MPNWLVSILKSIAIKPLFSYVISYIRGEASKTETKLDDAGVNVLEAISKADDYTLTSILRASITQLRIEAKKSETPFDDFAVDALEIILKDAKVI